MEYTVLAGKVTLRIIIYKDCEMTLPRIHMLEPQLGFVILILNSLKHHLVQHSNVMCSQSELSRVI